MPEGDRFILMPGRRGQQANLGDALEFAELSDTGRKRDHNEDSVGSDPERGIVTLADGMGGHNAGEVASRLAVETILRELPGGIDAIKDEGDSEEVYTPESLATRATIEQANRVIHGAAVSQPQYHGMGTTVIAAVFYDDRLTVAHVGDSRVYRLRQGALEQVTRDHTLLQELVDKGFYTPEEARHSLNRNVVTRALGVEPAVKVDVVEDICLPGDIYLLCSDGLNDMIEDEAIRLTLERFGANLERAADRLVAQANDNGGADNVSVVLVRVKKPFPSRQGWFKRVVDWFQ